jgi:hypothetical protein
VVVYSVESFAHVNGDGDGTFRWFLLVEPRGDDVSNLLESSGCGVLGFEAMLRGNGWKVVGEVR